MTCTIIYFTLEIYLCRQKQRSYPLPPSTPVTVLFIKAMTLKFSDFQFVLIKVLWKIKCNCMSGLFCIANLLKVGRKMHSFKFYGF